MSRRPRAMLPRGSSTEIRSALAAWLQEGSASTVEDEFAFSHRPSRASSSTAPALAAGDPSPAAASTPVVGRSGIYFSRALSTALGASGQEASEAALGHARAAPPPPPPPFELPPRLAASAGDCAICLDVLTLGQSCCRSPCMHIYHEACLSDWLHRGANRCPVCKLDLATPGRELRYRLKELEDLAAPELRYLAAYLGISISRGAERGELEMEVFGDPRVRVLCSREELHALPVSRLKALLRSVGLGAAAETSVGEKRDIVDALLASGRCVQEAPVAAAAAPPSARSAPPPPSAPPPAPAAEPQEEPPRKVARTAASPAQSAPPAEGEL